MPTAIMPIMPPAIAPLFEFDFDVDPVATKTLKKVVIRHVSKSFRSMWFMQKYVPQGIGKYQVPSTKYVTFNWLLESVKQLFFLQT